MTLRLYALALSALVWASVLVPGRASATPEDCDVNGQPVNRDNGASIEDKTGTMRCRVRDSGLITREEELRHGQFVGTVHIFKSGILEQEYTVDAEGDRDGRYREYAATPGANNPVLRDESYRNGRHVDRSRTFFASGKLRRVVVYGANDRELAVAELNELGQLSDLHCADHAVLEPDVRDTELCGYGSTPSEVELWSGAGRLTARVSFAHGERARETKYRADGTCEADAKQTAAGSVERSYAADGVKLEEVQFLGHGADKTKLLQQIFQPSGALQIERHYKRGALVLEQQWSANGQPRSKREATPWNGQAATRRSEYHDNGTLASDGFWIEQETTFGELRVGVHKTFDEAGTLRFERSYDGQGRPTRERTWDETGKLIRDETLFEDGSRHAFESLE